MRGYRKDKGMSEFKADLKKDLLIKSVLIPTIFVLITVLFCYILSNPNLNIFPHSDGTSGAITTQVQNDNISNGSN